MSDQALLNPDILRPILCLLRWLDLDECRRVCQTWRDEVDALRNFRPPVMITYEERHHKFVGILRERPLISIVFRNISDEDLASLGHQSQAVILPKIPYGSGLHGFSIPSIKGVQVCVFQFDKISPSNGVNYMSRWIKINRVIKNNIVKCALLFRKQGSFGCHSSLFQFDILGDIVSYISRNQPEEPEIAIGGGVVNRVVGVGGEGRKCSKKSTIILFHMPKSDGIVSHFKAFSNIFQDSKLEDELKLMSERVSLLKHSIAFKLSGWYRQEEDELFLKYFPNTPMVKCISYAQYGTVNYSVPDEPSIKCEKTDLECIFHHDSTSLVILTWK